MALKDELVAKLEQEAPGGYSWSNAPGDRYAAHSHAYEKVVFCVEGSITFYLGAGATAVELAAGDRLVLPAATVHAAVVGPNGCVCIEGHR